MDNDNSHDSKFKLNYKLHLHDSDDVLNQTDDFSGGYTPFKLAASKAVDKETKKKCVKPVKRDKIYRNLSSSRSNVTETGIEKRKQEPVKQIVTSENGQQKPIKEKKSFQYNDDEVCDKNAEKYMPENLKVELIDIYQNVKKSCELCKTHVLAEEYRNHIRHCLNAKFSRQSEKHQTDCVLCQICQLDITGLTVEKRNDHVNRCIDSSSVPGGNENNVAETEGSRDACDICKQCIGHLTATLRVAHLNQCADQLGELKAYEKKTKAKIHDCPGCGKVLKTLKTKKNHMKNCSTVEATSKPSIQKHKKGSHHGAQSKSNVDEDTQLAIALSNSLLENQKSDEVSLKLNQSERNEAPDKQHGKDVFSILMTPKPQEKGKRRKKVKLCIEKLPLLIQSEEETHSKLENKMASVLLDQVFNKQKIEESDTTLPEFRKSLISEKYLTPTDKNLSLWDKAIMDHREPITSSKEIYYVAPLIPPIVICQIKAGSKIKHMSSIAGWQAEDKANHNKRKSTTVGIPLSETNDSIIIAPSQTAMVLAELAQDHGTTILDKTHLLNQTEYTEQPSGFLADEKNENNLHQQQQAVFMFSNMVNNIKFSDITITVKDKMKVHAHKFVMCARSENILQNLDENDCLDLSSYSKDSVIALMNFLYAGFTKFKYQLLSEIHQLADRFDLADLGHFCSTMGDVQSTNEDYEIREIQNPDQTLQNILKEAWGSDSDDDSSECCNSYSDIEDKIMSSVDKGDINWNALKNNHDCLNRDEEELSTLYEVMATQRSRSSSKKMSVVDIAEDAKDTEAITERTPNKMILNRSSVKLNMTVCAGSVERMKHMSDSEVLEKVQGIYPKRDLLELTQMFTAMDSGSDGSESSEENDSLYDNRSDVESGILQLMCSDEETEPNSIKLKQPELGSGLTNIDLVDSVSDSNIHQSGNLKERICTDKLNENKTFSSDEELHIIDVLIDHNEDVTISTRNMSCKATPNKTSVLDSHINEDDITALLDDDSSFTTTQNSKTSNSDIKCNVTKSNYHVDNNYSDVIDNVSSHSAKTLMSNLLVDENHEVFNGQSPFKGEDSINMSVSNASCEELFDSLSECNSSKTHTPQQSQMEQINSSVRNHHRNSVNSTPSPVFVHSRDNSRIKDVTSDSVSAKQYLELKFSDDESPNTLSKNDNSSQKKRKRNQIDNDVGYTPSQKYRKLANDNDFDSVDGKNTFHDLSQRSSDLNLSEVSNSHSPKGIRDCKTDDKCIDLTSDDEHLQCKPLTDLDNLKGSDEHAAFSKAESSLDSRDIATGSPLQMDIYQADENLWDDFEDERFENDFPEAAFPNSPVRSPFKNCSSARKTNSKSPNKRRSHLRSPIYKKSSISGYVDKGTERTRIFLDSTLNNKLSSPQTDVVNANLEVKDNINDSFTMDESIYDPPTDISTNVSTLLDSEDDMVHNLQKDNQGSVGDKKYPLKTQLMPKRKKKSISNWVPPSPFTPVPNYETMATPQLQKQSKSYGVRAMPKKKMIVMLKNIYQESHAYETDPEFDQESVQTIKKDQSVVPHEVCVSTQGKKPRGRGKRPKANASTSQSNIKSVNNLEDALKKGRAKKKTTTAMNDSSCASSSGNDSYSNEELPEESILESDSQEPKLSKRDIEYKKKQLWNYVKSDVQLQLKLLHYEPIEFNEFQQTIKDNGLKNIGSSVLQEFLDEKNIPFTLRNQNKVTYGRKKGKSNRK